MDLMKPFSTLVMVGVLVASFHFALATGVAAQRTALIIGVEDYPEDSRFPDLSNPLNDAELVAKTLSRCGFSVTFVRNPSYGEMRAHLADWVGTIDPGGDAIFYFSGHGIEHEKTNFLMGSNSLFRNKFELGEEGMKADTVVAGILEREPKSALLFLDCCRENPDNTWLVSGTKGVKELGLGNMAHPDIVIAYSAAPGQVSLDGPKGANSPYASALVRGIKSGAELEMIFKSVRREVHDFTDGFQRTWETGSFLHDFFFSREAIHSATTSDRERMSALFSSGEVRRMPGDLLSMELGDGLAMTFAWCPPGEFVMGTPSNEEGRYADESQRRVKLSEGFWLGRREVTQEEYEAVKRTNPSRHRESTMAPVEQITWEEAAAFCAELNRRYASQLPAGYSFALPSEAQWEYACRAGSQGAYLGNLAQFSWYGKSLETGTDQVAQREPNPWGLHDMQGNVWEWCQDWYGAYPSTDETDPKGRSGGEYRVYRGGGYSSTRQDCRPGNRSAVSPASRFGFLGMRVAIRADL